MLESKILIFDLSLNEGEKFFVVVFSLADVRVLSLILITWSCTRHHILLNLSQHVASAHVVWIEEIWLAALPNSIIVHTLSSACRGIFFLEYHLNLSVFHICWIHLIDVALTVMNGLVLVDDLVLLELLNRLYRHVLLFNFRHIVYNPLTVDLFQIHGGIFCSNATLGRLWRIAVWMLGLLDDVGGWANHLSCVHFLTIRSISCDDLLWEADCTCGTVDVSCSVFPILAIHFRNHWRHF